jgi:photosystem II stability/assembly factor-like uncharacterized protein
VRKEETMLSTRIWHHLVVLLLAASMLLVGLGPHVSMAKADTGSDGHWEQLPLYGGEVYSLAMDPVDSSRLYAGTWGGVYRSVDSGKTWTPALSGPTDLYVFSIAVDSITPAILYAGTENGVFRSADGGTTWANASKGIYNRLVTNSMVPCVVIDPKVPSTVYATCGNLFRSDDRGGRWVPVSTGIEDYYVSALAIDNSAPATLYVGTAENGVFRSTDSGASWTGASEGLGNASVYCLAMDSSASSIYAGTDKGMFRSDDHGTTWTSASAGIEGLPVYGVSSEPPASTTIYATTEKGLFRSADRGRSWTPVSVGSVEESIMCLLVNPAVPSELYAGTSDHGVLRSVDAGVTWTQASSGLANLYVQDIAIDDVGHVLYAGTNIHGIFRSTDGGETWSPANKGLTSLYIGAIIVDPGTPSTVYAGVSGDYYGTWVFRSTDGGVTWQAASTELGGSSTNALVVGAGTPAALYAGTDGGGVYRSDDGGANWTASSGSSTISNVYGLTIDPFIPTTLYAACHGGVFRSDDSGGTWMKCSTGLGDSSACCLALDPVTPGKLYVGTDSLGVFRSDNRGTSWTHCSEGLTNMDIPSLAIDPITPGVLYAGSYGDGVFRSTDYGATWTPASTLPPNTEIASLTFDPTKPSSLFACTNHGLYRWVPPDVTAMVPPSSPRDLGAVSSASNIKLRWLASTPGSTPLGGYAVFRSTTTGSADDTPFATTGADVTTWTDTTCQQGTTYYYSVAAFDTATPPLSSTRSQEVSARLLGPPGLVTLSTPPDGATVDSLTPWLAWTAAEEARSYTVQIGITAAFSSVFGELTDVSGLTVCVPDRLLLPGRVYYWRVASVNAGGASPWSPVFSFTTKNPQVSLTLTLQMGNTRMLVSGSDGTSETVTLDAAPVLGAGNRTLVPVRAVAEAMGGTVDWNATTRTASVTVGSNTLELTLGKNTALFNGTPTQIDTDPKVLPLIINGRTMLPLRFVVESLGAEVSYDQATKTITITYTKT